MIDGHGDDLWRYGDTIRGNFSSNIHTRPGMHRDLMAHLAGCADLLSRYPEPEPLSLERALARSLGVGPQSVMVTNGATEAIYLIAMAFSRQQSDILGPTFREYEDACALYSHTINHISEPEQADGDLLWLCCPNNPTGSVLDIDRLRRVIADGRRRLTIVDASYSDYTLRPVLTPPEFAAAPRALMLYSLTKRYGVPGLRIGYLVGHSDTLAPLRRRRMPWSVNALAIEAAAWLDSHAELYPIDAAGLHDQALEMGRRLAEAGVEVLPTECNFLLCRLPRGLRASDLKGALVEREGLLIRDASNFTGLTPSYFRVAAQSPELNRRLTDAIILWIKQSY